MRRLVVIAALLMPCVVLGQQLPAQPLPRLTLYKTAGSAACSGDVAVWIDPDTRIYYVKGEKLFGKTKHGGYNCRKQAEAAGYRSAKER